MPNLLAAIGSAVDRNALDSKSPQEMGQYSQKMRSSLGNKKFAPWADNMRQQVVARRNPVLGSLKKGGDIKKTGLYQLHAGEEVIPAKERALLAGMDKKYEGTAHSTPKRIK